MKIRDWEDLKSLPKETRTHVLEIEEDGAWLKAKNKKEYDLNLDYLSQVSHIDVYLHTHTFYEDFKDFSTTLFQACGFNITIV